MSAASLVVEFDVAATPAHAFAAWTQRCERWWPKSHTASGDPANVSFEAFPGGRIVELGPAGDEHVWGSVLDWEPPLRLRYLWHLFFAPEEATEVEVTVRTGGAGTVVRLEQRGFERLGAAGPPRRARTETVWALIGCAFAAHLDGVDDVAGDDPFPRVTCRATVGRRAPGRGHPMSAA